jgi:hypothetical protein
MLLDPHNGFAAGDGFAPFDGQPHDLTVIEVRPTVLQRIKEGFLQVVDIAPASIRRKHSHLDCQWSQERLHLGRREDRADRMAEYATPAADQRAVPHAPPVVIHTRRIWQFEREHHERFQGGVLLAAGDIGAAGGGVSFLVKPLSSLVISPVSVRFLHLT